MNPAFDFALALRNARGARNLARQYDQRGNEAMARRLYKIAIRDIRRAKEVRKIMETTNGR